MLKDCWNIGSQMANKIYGVKHNFLAKRLLPAYNTMGIFSNLADSQEDLEAELRAHFSQCTICIQGSVAIYSARN